MENWFTRLVQEEKELDDKFIKLTLFIGTENYFKLNFHERAMLIEQKAFMFAYLQVLRERIKYANEVENNVEM